MNSSLDDLWCVDCDRSQHGACKKHRSLHKIEDAVIPSRARLTLPPSLSLKTVKEDGKICVGVYAKRLIPIRSQFGPFDAPVISKTPVKVPKPKEEKTVWKKKHAMQKSLEQSAMSQSSDSMEQGLSADMQTSPVIATVQPGTPLQRPQLGSMMNASAGSGTMLAGALHSNDTLNQNLLSLSNQLIAHPELADSLQKMQQGLQMTSPGPGPGHLQLPMHSTPLLTSNQAGHLQLQGNLQDFPALNFQSPPQGNMQVPIMAENLQNLQEQYQSYNPQIDLASQHQSANLNGFVTPNSMDNLSVSLPTMQPNQSGSGSSHGAPPTDNESQSAEDSGVGDTSHANMSDSTILDYTSDTDVEDSIEQDLTFELKVSTDDGYLETYDKTDEDHSNWMIFVRPARFVAEQNLVAYQEDGQIFFVSTKAIAPNTEMKVWYSRDYAKSIGKSMLPTEEQTEQDGKEDPLKCSACRVTFSNTSDFDNHLCLSKVKGRRKGRPRKYVKPTKTWRAKLEKARLKESIVKQEIGGTSHPKRRGRPRIKPIVIKTEKSTGTLRAEQVKSELVKHEPKRSEEPRLVIQDMADEDFDDDDLDRDEPEYIIALDNDNVTVTPLVAEIKVKKKRGPKTRKDPFVCPHCDMKIVAEVQYHMHVYGHTGIKPFVCDHKDCGRGFMSKFKLERHSLIHSSPRHHKCLYCDKSFNRKDHLKNHMITHDPNKKVWKCERCAKEYSYSFSYRTHMAFHAAESGETLDCGICKKSFEKKEDLLFHLKVHTGARAAKNATEKIHGCPECDKKFFTRKDVKRHLITHTKKRDFLCQFCPQRFGRKDHLSRHLRTSHTGDGQNTKMRKTPGEGTTPKKRERILYEKLEPTMVPLVNLASMSEEDQQLFAGTTVVSGSQAALLQNLQYAISQMPGQPGVREIQIPAGMFEVAAAAATSQPVSAASISNIQPPPGMPSTQTSTQPHYTINEKGYIMNANQADANVLRQMHPGIDYRTLSQAVQQGNMYIASALPQEQLTQDQQQPTLIATPTKIDPQTAAELNRANGILQAAEYQLTPTKSTAVSDSPNRASVLMANADQRQNPQAYQSLVGYIETLKFLENLPTNTGAASAIQLQQLQNIANAQNVVNVQNLQTIEGAQQAHLIPVTYTPSSSLNQNVININQADLKNYIAVPHSPTQSDLKSLVAMSQNVNQADLKNMVALSHNPTAAELKNIVALSQSPNQADIKSLIALSQMPNQAELKNMIALSQAQNSLGLQQDIKGMVVTHSPGQQVAYQQQSQS